MRIYCNGILIYCWWNCKLVESFWKTVWQELLKLNICLLYDPRVLLSVVYTQQKAAYMFPKAMCRDIHSSSKWKQATCPLLLEWKFMLCLYNRTCYSNENEQTTATYNCMNKSHRHNVKQKKQVIKEGVVKDFIYIKFKRGKNNLWWEVRIAVNCGGRKIRRTWRKFLG